MAEAEDNRKEQHWLMLRDLSDEIASRHVCIDMLKFALFDFVFIKGNLQNAKNAFTIFKELDNVGFINPDNVTLLIALFKLLWLNSLNDIFFKSKFQIENVDPKKIFSSFRISIVNLSNKLQNDEIKKIGDMYAVRQETHLNPWKLLQYLQDEGELCKENLMDFMEKTGINKDFLEWHPAKMLPTATENNRRPQHLLMLEKLSHEIEHRNVNIDMLKFALFDFVLIRTNLDYATDAFDLFMELDNVGYINSDNVELLIAVFKLLWLNSLNNEILKYEFQVEDVHPKDKFTSFRISIVALSSNLQNHNMKKIAGVFTVPVKKCPNPWKLLQYLQDKGKVGEENLMEFMEKTRISKGVKVTFKQKKSRGESSCAGQPCSKLPKLEDDPQNGLHYLANNTRLRERRVHSAYEASDIFSEIGVDQTKSEGKSIIFHISSYDPNALKNLCTMCLNGKLLEKMSEILVIEKYKQRFLGEWTIIIDKDQFNSAVSKLEQKIAFWSKITSSAALTRSTSMESGISSQSTSSAALTRSISWGSALSSKLTSSPESTESRVKVSALGPESGSSRSSKSAIWPRFPSSRSLQSVLSSVSTSSQTSAKLRSKVSAFLSTNTSSSISGKSRSKESGNVIVQNMDLLLRNPIKVDLTGDLTLNEEKPFVIKEGATFQIRFKFLVRRTKVKGIRYKQVISRKGKKVESVFVFGNYQPKEEPYSYVTTALEAPKGRLGCGHYTVKSKIDDEDKIVYLKWKWIIHVKHDNNSYNHWIRLSPKEVNYCFPSIFQHSVFKSCIFCSQ